MGCMFLLQHVAHAPTLRYVFPPLRTGFLQAGHKEPSCEHAQQYFLIRTATCHVARANVFVLSPCVCCRHVRAVAINSQCHAGALVVPLLNQVCTHTYSFRCCLQHAGLRPPTPAAHNSSACTSFKEHTGACHSVHHAGFFPCSRFILLVCAYLFMCVCVCVCVSVCVSWCVTWLTR